MVKKNFPKNYFSSYEEYLDYMTCLSRIEPGDKVMAYFHGIIAAKPSSHKTNYVQELIVIGKVRTSNIFDHKQVLLGSNTHDMVFWRFYPGVMPNEVKNINFISNIEEYQYAFLAMFGDIRIAEIIKGK